MPHPADAASEDTRSAMEDISPVLAALCTDELLFSLDDEAGLPSFFPGVPGLSEPESLPLSVFFVIWNFTIVSNGV